MRPHDWQLRMAELYEARRNQPFAWGERDCCLWAADVVLAITGIDHAAELRGIYCTPKEALRLIEQMGGLRGFVTAALGPEINPRLAQPGDVGLVLEPPTGEALVAKIGTPWIGQGPDGLVPIQREAVVAAWRCCRG